MEAEVRDAMGVEQLSFSLVTWVEGVAQPAPNFPQIDVGLVGYGSSIELLALTQAHITEPNERIEQVLRFFFGELATIDCERDASMRRNTFVVSIGYPSRNQERLTLCASPGMAAST